MSEGLFKDWIHLVEMDPPSPVEEGSANFNVSALSGSLPQLQREEMQDKDGGTAAGGFQSTQIA